MLVHWVGMPVSFCVCVHACMCVHEGGESERNVVFRSTGSDPNCALDKHVLNIYIHSQIYNYTKINK